MNAKSVKLTAVSVMVGLALVVWFRPAIQAQDKLPTAQMATNWMGGLVVGKKEIGDRIAGNILFPQADGEIEIGLRSDGMVVWRKAR